MFFIKTFLLTVLLCCSFWTPGFTKKSHKANSFIITGKKQSDRQSYDFVFDIHLQEKYEKELEYDKIRDKAFDTFSVPEHCTLISKRDDPATTQLLYGDYVRIWHPQSGYYLQTHEVKYNHTNSSHQYQVFLLSNDNRNEADRQATWWQVVGPHGSELQNIIGKPVDLSKAVRLIAASKKINSHSLTGAALHSHSYEKHEHISPTREEDNEEYEPKQEVTAYQKRDTNDNWLFIKNKNPEERTHCKIGSLFSLMHQNSNHYLRAKKGVEFNLHDQLINKEPNVHNEVSCVQKQRHPETTFQIALIVRNNEINQNLFLSNYLEQFNNHQHCTISSHNSFTRGQGKWRKTIAKNLLDNYKNSLRQSVTKFKPSEKKVQFSIVVDQQQKTLGIQSIKNQRFLQQDHAEPNILQRTLLGKKMIWHSQVKFTDQKFRPTKGWIPINAGFGKIYLQHKNSKWFLTIEKQKIDNVDVKIVTADKYKKAKFTINKKNIV